MPGRNSERMAGRPDRPQRVADRGGAGRGAAFSYGSRLERLFTAPDREAYSCFRWEQRDVRIVDRGGERVVFEGRELEFPAGWSETACKITASKYFKKSARYSDQGLRQLVDRVADTITGQGDSRGYFLDAEEREAFRQELKFLLCDQRACFNSPVLFNIGVPGERPQASACFINSVKDDMVDISRLIVTEGQIFKWGSGSGVNFSPLRAEGEALSTGGTASGPLSFMKVLDANAGAIKSGGKSRRAAKMCVLDIRHPDVERFIDSKVLEEKKAQALIDAGYDSSICGEAYATVAFQNANHSVRVGDDFMRAVEEDRPWELKAVVAGETVKTVPARELLRRMAQAAWITGDPGIQFDTATNAWHTCPESGRINASNPCGEYVFLDDSACNLSSINLLKFVEGGRFLVEEFAHAVRVMLLAQEILCAFAVYPTVEITRNSHDFSPLGLGYTNLGALLMVHGLPYDSDQSRALAAAITALMTGLACEVSGWIAGRLGPFPAFRLNERPLRRVLGQHRAALGGIAGFEEPPVFLEELRRQALASWERVCDESRYAAGFRNAQVTLLAPTGTISFFMDAVTTGIEPELSLVKLKNMVDGSQLSLVNPLLPRAMRYLGLDRETIAGAERHVATQGDLGEFELPEELKRVFATSLGAPGRVTTLRPEAHLRMMAAVQPFLSGAISKTVNLPEDSTVEDIERMYFDSWKLGLKSVTIYRNNCKRSQPLEVKPKAHAPTEVATVPKRRRLPTTRRAITHKFEIAGHEGYLTAGCYEDGRLGEIFILMHKEGSILSGLLDSLGIITSIALQYGAPLEVLVDKMIHMRFEPSGLTRNPQIPMAKSVVDYIFRWLGSEFLSPEQQEQIGIRQLKSAAEALAELSRPKPGQGPAAAWVGRPREAVARFDSLGDAPSCGHCGSLMERRGTCYTCPSCGETTGCS